MDYIWATGRRKCGAAQVRIRAGSGRVSINKKEFEVHFNTEALRGYILQPLMVTGSEGKYDIVVTVKGGGSVGQAGAVRHGLARALVKIDESLKDVLKDSGMLTRDARVKERKKPGQPGARKRFQFSKR
jgi:small subunit ribosomal protein S9